MLLWPLPVPVNAVAVPFLTVIAPNWPLLLLCARWLAVAPAWNAEKSVVTCRPLPSPPVDTVMLVLPYCAVTVHCWFANGIVWGLPLTVRSTPVTVFAACGWCRVPAPVKLDQGTPLDSMVNEPSE